MIEPIEPPITGKTRTILAHFDEKFKEIQDVTEEVREIRRILASKETRWKALLRGIKQFLSQVD